MPQSTNTQVKSAVRKERDAIVAHLQSVLAFYEDANPPTGRLDGEINVLVDLLEEIKGGEYKGCTIGSDYPDEGAT